jgi:hypothetical protein
MKGNLYQHIKIRHAYDFSLCFPHELLMSFWIINTTNIRGRSQCRGIALVFSFFVFFFLVVASVTSHCGIVGSGYRNLAKTCSGDYDKFYTMLTRTSSVFNYVTNLRRCNCGTYFIIFHCACAWTFSVFFDKISLNSILVLYGFLLCRTLNVCDHEVTAVKKWGTSIYFKLFFRILRWYFTNREGQCERLSRRLVLYINLLPSDFQPLFWKAIVAAQISLSSN